MPLVQALPRRTQLGLQRGQERGARSRELLGRLQLSRCTCWGPCRRRPRLCADCCIGCMIAFKRRSAVPRTEVRRWTLPDCGLRPTAPEPRTAVCTVSFGLVELIMSRWNCCAA